VLRIDDVQQAARYTVFRSTVRLQSLEMISQLVLVRTSSLVYTVNNAVVSMHNLLRSCGNVVSCMYKHCQAGTAKLASSYQNFESANSHYRHGMRYSI
jgi:hypothetical protein